MPYSDANSTIACSPDTVNANGYSATTITVTVRDGDNQPLDGVNISCFGSGSSVVPGGDVTTDASGVATFAGKNTVAETVQFYAIATPPANPNLPDPDRSSIVCSPTTVVADGTASTTITITLRNAANEPLEGIVTDCGATGPAQVGAGGVEYAETNADGVAVFPSGISSAAATVQFYTNACPGLFSNQVTFVEPP